MENKKFPTSSIFAGNDVFLFVFVSKIIFSLKSWFSKGIIFSVVRARDDEFLLRYESRINGLPLGYLVDGLPSAASLSLGEPLNIENKK